MMIGFVSKPIIISSFREIHLKHGLKFLENGYHGNRKKPKNCIFARKNLGLTDLKLDMYIQLQCGIKMGWIPLGHTSSFPCVGQKMPKVVFQQEKKTLGSYTHEPIYIRNRYNLWNVFSTCQAKKKPKIVL